MFCSFATIGLCYGDDLCMGVSGSSVAHLQLVQNAAARLNSLKEVDMTLAPATCPFKKYISKFFLLPFKAVNGFAPVYLCELLHPDTPSRSLRSADLLLLKVAKTTLRLRGDQAFSVVAPKLWN